MSEPDARRFFGEGNELVFDTWKMCREYIFSSRDQGLALGIAYRGQSSSEWRLTSYLERIRHTEAPPIFDDLYQRIENDGPSRFRFGSHLFLPEGQKPENIENLEWLTLMQHHGVPTRLIDITVSPFVAAFFALRDFQVQHDYAAIYEFDLKILDIENSERLPFKDGDVYQQIYNYYGKSIFTLEEKVPIIGYYYPSSPSMRPFLQKGGFIFTNTTKNKFEDTLAEYGNVSQIVRRFLIKRNEVNLMDAYRDFKIMNISHVTLFGGLDAYASDIAMDTFVENR
jgi:hypothetical protein